MRERVYLHPGRSLVATEPTIVTTILGSCVSVCLWDESAHIGGLTHYLLPDPIGPGDPARFGTTAIVDLVDHLHCIGATELVAKIFGGASMNSALAALGRDLGTRNSEVACEMLRTLGVSIVARDVGGAHGRKLLFQTDDGLAWVKVLETR